MGKPRNDRQELKSGVVSGKSADKGLQQFMHQEDYRRDLGRHPSARSDWLAKTFRGSSTSLLERR